MADQTVHDRDGGRGIAYAEGRSGEWEADECGDEGFLPSDAVHEENE